MKPKFQLAIALSLVHLLVLGECYCTKRYGGRSNFEENEDDNLNQDDGGGGDEDDQATGKMYAKIESLLPEDCGRAPKFRGSSYIAGGFNARLGEYPSYVRLDLLKNGKSQGSCGGTLITDRHILTAAHCLEPHVADGALAVPTIYLVRHGETRHEVKGFCYSPNYRGKVPHKTHDLGLITLKKPIVFTDTVQPACLPRSPLRRDENKLRAVGLGAIDITLDPETGDQVDMKDPEILQVLPVRQEECDRKDKGPTTICFVSSSSKHVGDTCVGDSGGPIYGLRDGRMTVFGATSYGPPICKVGHQGKSVNADIWALGREIEALFERCG